MTTSGLVAIVVPTATALLIGFLHRKQMRQNELFRANPEVGVVPAPSPPVAFVIRHWRKIVGFGGPIVSLLMLYFAHIASPYLTAIIAAFDFSMIVFTAMMLMNEGLLDLLQKHLATTSAMLRSSEVMLAQQKAMLANEEGHINATGALANHFERLQERVKALESERRSTG